MLSRDRAKAVLQREWARLNQIEQEKIETWSKNGEKQELQARIDAQAQSMRDQTTQLTASQRSFTDALNRIQALETQPRIRLLTVPNLSTIENPFFLFYSP